MPTEEMLETFLKEIEKREKSAEVFLITNVVQTCLDEFLYTPRKVEYIHPIEATQIRRRVN